MAEGFFGLPAKPGPQKRMADALMGADAPQEPPPFPPWHQLGQTTEGRPVVVNPDGGLSTELQITVPDPRAAGMWLNIPSLYGGRPVGEDEAMRIMQGAGFIDPETGRDYGASFPTVQDAVRAAESRSQSDGMDPNFEWLYRAYMKARGM